MYKDPGCSCCDRYADYLGSHGRTTDVRATDQMQRLKTEYGVPSRVTSCHTIVTDGYVIEGHVPIRAVRRLVGDRPDLVGIALPGMPAGSPGMGGVKSEPFVVYEIRSDGSVEPFMEV